MEGQLREIRKLVDILNTWGNVLVPTIPGQQGETYAQEKLKFLCANLAKEHGLSVDDISVKIQELPMK